MQIDWMQLLTLLLSSAITAFVSYLTYRLQRIQILMKQNSEHLVNVADNVDKIEKATNNAQNELVKATAEAAFAAGEKAGAVSGIWPPSPVDKSK